MVYLMNKNVWYYSAHKNVQIMWEWAIKHAIWKQQVVLIHAYTLYIYNKKQ